MKLSNLSHFQSNVTFIIFQFEGRPAGAFSDRAVRRVGAEIFKRETRTLGHRVRMYRLR